MKIRFFKSYIEISRIQNELNKIFHNLIEAQEQKTNELTRQIIPEVDIFETEHTLTLKIDLPGVLREDIKLSLSGNNLLITGIKRQIKLTSEKVKFHCLERNYGNFSRVVHLGIPIDTSNVKARLENGLLNITFNKIVERRQKEIPIEIKNSN